MSFWSLFTTVHTKKKCKAFQILTLWSWSNDILKLAVSWIHILKLTIFLQNHLYQLEEKYQNLLFIFQQSAMQILAGVHLLNRCYL